MLFNAQIATSRKLALAASKGCCVLVSWQPRHQQDDEAAGEDASTGSADTEPCTQHVSRHFGRPNVAVLKAFEADRYAGLWLRPL